MNKVEIRNRNKTDIRALSKFLLISGIIRRGEETKLLGEGKKEENNNQSGTKYFYDINKNSESEVAGAFLEEGVTADVRRRIHKADPYPESLAAKSNWEYNEHSSAEKIATENAFELGKQGYNLVIWISPEDGKIYKEGRLNVYMPVRENGEWVLYMRGIPLTWDKDESTKLGQRLIENGGRSFEKISDSESLRRQPVGIKIEKMDEWLNECRKLMPEFIDYWDFIENGEDIKNKEAMEAAVRRAKAAAKGDNVKFELEMQRQGFRINAEGGHGSSYLGKGVFTGKIRMTGGEAYIKPVEVGGKLVCPICGEELNKEMGKCPKCGAKMEK